MVLSIICIAFSYNSIVQATPPWEQVHKLLSSDGAIVNQFGYSVAVSGNLGVIGERFGEGITIDSGSAYVFDVITGQQLFKLIASDGKERSEFGWSVAVSGNLAVIGARYDDTINGIESGSVYVFDITTGQQLLKLIPSDGGKFNQFGSSVAVRGNLAVIGQWSEHSNGNFGSAYVFDISTGQELFKLLAADGIGGQFGISVALDGNLALIGAERNNVKGELSGAAYIFDITTGKQLFKLYAADGSSHVKFGHSVAISGNFALVGAFHDDVNGRNTGSAYVFDATTGKQLFKLHAADGATDDYFGQSVAIDKSLAIIGANGDSDADGNATGSAYVFDVTTGKQLFKLLADDGSNYDYFGYSAAISGSNALIGAVIDNSDYPDSGSAYVFNPRTTNYLSVKPITLKTGTNATFSMVQTLPNENSWLLYTLNGLDPTLIPQLNVTVALNNPKIASGPKQTNSDGNLQFVLPVPSVPYPVNIWFQSVQNRNTTNFVPTQIVP